MNLNKLTAHKQTEEHLLSQGRGINDQKTIGGLKT